jgi:hypothetical protein
LSSHRISGGDVIANNKGHEAGTQKGDGYESSHVEGVEKKTVIQ